MLQVLVNGTTLNQIILPTARFAAQHSGQLVSSADSLPHRLLQVLVNGTAFTQVILPTARFVAQHSGQVVPGCTPGEKERQGGAVAIAPVMQRAGTCAVAN